MQPGVRSSRCCVSHRKTLRSSGSRGKGCAADLQRRNPQEVLNAARGYIPPNIGPKNARFAYCIARTPGCGTCAKEV